MEMPRSKRAVNRCVILKIVTDRTISGKVQGNGGACLTFNLKGKRLIKIESVKKKQASDKPVLLVVDDTPENITVLRAILYADYVVRPAINGTLALRLAKVEPPPDLILLDIMMPEIDGLEVCRRLKADQKTRDIPVVFVTAKSEVDDELQGLALGAVDYITKPINPAIVLARVKTHLSLKQMRQELTLKNAELEEKNHALNHEREMVETIVLKMRSAQQFDARGLRYLVSSVEETNGDILLSAYDAMGRQVVLVGDFTGHGLPAAIGGPLVSYIFYTMVQKRCTLLELITEINQVLHNQLPTGVFMVSCTLEITPERHQVTLLNAAIPDPLLVRAGEIVTRYGSDTFPLGIVPDLKLNPELVTLAVVPGDRLYVFSDGIIEATSTTGEMFNMERLEALLLQVQSKNLPLATVLETLDDFCATQCHDDDITLVEVQI